MAPAPFAPNVIRGDFSGRFPAVRAANEAAAVHLPLYGRIAAGLPIEAMRDQGTQIEVPLALLGNGEHYALEVAGDSMVEAGILDGDTVVIRKGDVAENGQIVVARVDGELTVKRFERGKERIRLLPRNPDYAPIVVSPDADFAIEGLYCGLVRGA